MTGQNFVTNGMNYRSRFVETGFGRLHYIDTSQPGEPIVFIHGFPGSHRDWSRFFHFKYQGVEHRRKIVVDLRGFGKSIPDKPIATSSISDLLSDLFLILNHAQVHRCSIIGHDIGAMIGWWAAIVYPQHIKSLIALACPHPSAYAANYTTLEKSGRIRYQNELFKEQNRVELAQLINIVEDVNQKRNMIDVLKISDLETIRGIYRGCLDPNLFRKNPNLPKIKLPVLLAYDENDPYFIPAMWHDHQKWIEAQFTLIELNRIGHFIPQNATEEQIDQIYSFL